MLEGWFFITAGLLVLSGGSKIRNPDPTRGALRAAGLPSSPGAVYALAAVEIGLGAAALAIPHSAIAAGVAILYLGFAVFVGMALARRLPLQSCGCFGKSDTPPGPIHLGVNLATAAVAGVVATGGGADLLEVLADQPAAGIPYLGFVAVGVVATALILSELPAVLPGRAR
ncbi:MAG: hypothetical protein R3246_00970 [Acidimicrobiia bacterium]|nr:hypothetical protein [Acidimicrobiia bacterium]